MIRKLPANKLKALYLFLFSVFSFPLSVAPNRRWLLFFCFKAIFGCFFFCFYSPSVCVCCAPTWSLMLIDDVDWKDWCDEPIIKSGPSLSPSSCGGSVRVPQLSKCWWGTRKTNERNSKIVEMWKSCCCCCKGQKRNFGDEVRETF